MSQKPEADPATLNSFSQALPIPCCIPGVEEEVGLGVSLDEAWAKEPAFLNISIFSSYTFVHPHSLLTGAGFQFSVKEESDVTARDAGPHTSWH